MFACPSLQCHPSQGSRRPTPPERAHLVVAEFATQAYHSSVEDILKNTSALQHSCYVELLPVAPKSRYCQLSSKCAPEATEAVWAEARGKAPVVAGKLASGTGSETRLAIYGVCPITELLASVRKTIHCGLGEEYGNLPQSRRSCQ